jgi:transposase
MTKHIQVRDNFFEDLDSGFTQAEAAERAHIHERTGKNWIKQRRETGQYAPQVGRINPTRIYHDEDVLAFVKEKPKATLAEMAKAFGGTISGADSALRRLKVTLKSERPSMKRETK